MNDPKDRPPVSLPPLVGMSLGEVVREVPGASFEPGAAVRGEAAHVTGVHHDSRRLGPGDLFVALRGRSSDGAAHVEAARARGAVGVLASEGHVLPPTPLPVLRAKDARRAMAFAASAVYGHPSFALDVVGITGTNGKTTTTHLVRTAVDGALGRAACGLVGTVGVRLGDALRETTHTTPESDELARVFAWMRARGGTHAAMEVSSIAVVEQRVAAVRFRVAAFGNLTRDHVDYHGSMEAYADAKRALFTEHAPGSAVINVADPFGARLAAETRCPVLTVDPRPGAAADVRPRALALDAGGLRMTVDTPSGAVEIASRMLGAHNAENLLVALGVALALDLDPARAAAALGGEAGAPGRLERCDGPEDDVAALVDYAHTPDALERVLAAVRGAVAPAAPGLPAGRVICVFGCGGDRDPGKRGPMGEAVGRAADVAVVTSDNPRTESPEAIARPVEAGVRAAGQGAASFREIGEGASGYVVELDRARAIAEAVAHARPGDLVLVAGKGHEDYQIVGAEKRPFDDREELRRALAARRARAVAP